MLDLSGEMNLQGKLGEIGHRSSLCKGGRRWREADDTRSFAVLLLVSRFIVAFLQAQPDMPCFLGRHEAAVKAAKSRESLSLRATEKGGKLRVVS